MTADCRLTLYIVRGAMTPMLNQMVSGIEACGLSIGSLEDTQLRSWGEQTETPTIVSEEG